MAEQKEEVKEKEYKGWIKVTNIPGYFKDGRKMIGFPIDGYLKANLDGIPGFLKKGYDCIIIVSGNGKVRIGKSVCGIGTVGSYVVWRLAGGIHECHQEIIEGKQRWVTDRVVQPKKELNWNVHENVAFSAEELQKKAIKLYNKYGPRQVIVYDEGRQGLDSARAMESINKGMEDFMQTCGFMNHVIIIILPNFFKLHEDYAIARSISLINVYADKQYNRGYFSFYNEEQKEKLFYFGKKLIGIRARYNAARENFYGKFSSWFPFDRQVYDKLKEAAMVKTRQTKHQLQFKKQRDIALYLVKKYSEMSCPQIAREFSALVGKKISDRLIRYAIANASHQKVGDVE